MQPHVWPDGDDQGIVGFITVIVASCIQCCSLSVQSIPAFAEFAFVLLAFAGSLAPWRSLQRLDLIGVSYNGHGHKEAQCIEVISSALCPMRMPLIQWLIRLFSYHDGGRGESIPVDHVGTQGQCPR